MGSTELSDVLVLDAIDVWLIGRAALRSVNLGGSVNKARHIQESHQVRSL